MTSRRRDLSHIQVKVAKSSSCRDPQLQAHQVQTKHFFCNGVLDLKPRVALDEDDGVAVDQEFHSAKAPVAGGPSQRDRVSEQALPDRHRHRIGGRNFHHLLALPLQRAFAVVQMADRYTVPDNLHLDVPRAGQEPFDIEVAVAERRPGLGGAACERFVQIHQSRHRPHAASAAAGDGLDHHRAMGREKGLRLLKSGRPVGSGQHRHAALLCQRPRPALVAKQFKCVRAWSDEGQTRRCTSPRERRILAEEPISRMHRVGPGIAGRSHYLFDVEIGRRARALQANRLVSLARVQ